MPRIPTWIQGPAGTIESLLYLPDQADYSNFAIICHPDPLQQGTMHNKVVTTVAKTFNQHNIPAITFNYRGVEHSEGSYGNIVGEVQDCLAVINWVQQQRPQAQLYLAGFSFGAFIAAAVATQLPVKYLISLAPSVVRMPYQQLGAITCPWLIIMPEDDEVVSPSAVYTWYEGLQANKRLIRMPETGHFFHGKLQDLASNMQEIFEER